MVVDPPDPRLGACVRPVHFAVAVAGALAPAVPLARRAHAAPARARLRELRRAGPEPPGHRTGAHPRRRLLPGVTLASPAQRPVRADRPGAVRDAPALYDLVAVVLAAGGTPYRALGVAARWGPPALRDPLRRAVAEAQDGSGTRAALTRLAEHPVEAVAVLARTLRDAATLGAPVAELLARQARAERHRLRRAAEAHARTVAVRLLFPLVGAILPAFGLLTVVPTLLAALRAL